jgi:hypothetical protein
MLEAVKHVVWTNVRDELVVDAYPCLPWAVVHVAIGMEDVQGIMAARRGLAVMVESCECGTSVRVNALRLRRTNLRKAGI